MPQPRQSETPSELELLRALSDSPDGSPPSQVQVERALESGLARLMLLEGRLREHASGPGGTRRGEEPHENEELIEEIRVLREAVVQLRARTNLSESAPLAQGFVIARQH